MMQLHVGLDNFSYIIQCEKTGKSVLVDPGSNASEALRLIGKENLDLVAIINTHNHLDHIAENLRVAEIYKCDIIASEPDSIGIEGVTRTVSDGEAMMIGSVRLEFILTPGHTLGSMCMLVDGMALLTGDTLFMGDCGRTDLPDGSNTQMFASLQRLKTLPDDVIVYPGHDYGGMPSDTLGNQKRANKTLTADSPEIFSAIP